MITHQLTLAGEVARHVDYVAHHAAAVRLSALASEDTKLYAREIGRRNRRLVIDAIAGGATRMAEIKAALADIDLGLNSVRNTVYKLINEGVIEPVGKHNSRQYLLKGSAA